MPLQSFARTLVFVSLVTTFAAVSAISVGPYTPVEMRDTHNPTKASVKPPKIDTPLNLISMRGLPISLPLLNSFASTTSTGTPLNTVSTITTSSNIPATSNTPTTSSTPTTASASNTISSTQDVQGRSVKSYATNSKAYQSSTPLKQAVLLVSPPKPTMTPFSIALTLEKGQYAADVLLDTDISQIEQPNVLVDRSVPLARASIFPDTVDLDERHELLQSSQPATYSPRKPRFEGIQRD